MLQRLTTQLPIWARPAHPILRYNLKTQQISRWAQFGRALGVVVVGLVAGVVGYLVLLATDFPKPAPGQYLTESLLNVIFWPALFVQVLTRLAVIALTVNTVSEEKRRQTWDKIGRAHV